MRTISPKNYQIYKLKNEFKSVDYELPKELIAKNPASPRDSSSLVEVKESFEIYKFTYLINLLKKVTAL